MNSIEDYVNSLDTEESVDPMDSVFEKIEQANLYKALLNAALFDESSASPETVEKVTQEIRQFVSNRLQALVGLASPESFNQAPLPFTDQQIAALKVLADRILSSTGSDQIQRQAPPVPKRNIVKVQQTIVQKPNIQKSVATPKTQKRNPNRKPSANVSEVTGQDYSQAVNPSNPPLRQPSQAEIDQRNAQQVAVTQSKMGSDDWGKILQSAAKIYQKQNENVSED